MLKGWIATKGALAGPFVFAALIGASMGSRVGAVAPWFVAALALGGVAWSGAARSEQPSPISVAVFAFAALVVASTLLWSAAYTPAGLYQPLLLVAAFYVARGLAHEQQRSAAGAMAIILALLACWGVVQVALLGSARATTLFETPATYAAILNLGLVPLLAAALVGSRSRLWAAGAVLLAAGMFAAGSRGGLLALAAGCGVAGIFAWRLGALRLRSVALAFAVVMAGWGTASVLRTLPSAPQEAMPTAEAQAASSLSRLELYALSWEAWRERPILGTGYHTFRYTLEQGRAEVPSYGRDRETWFVHNDYLQVLQELGLVGLVAFLGITLLPLVVAYRRVRDLPKDVQTTVIASASALGAMATHAVVDFPFYVPASLLLYGAWLGALDRRIYRPSPAALKTEHRSVWRRGATAAVGTLAAILLLRPVAAEAAAEWGLRQSASGSGQSAAFWLGAARRIDAQDWRYHWYAGQFWDAQAATSGRREAASLAAQAYAAGFEANPLEVKNLLGMISVHQRYGHLLDVPADRQTLERWQARATHLAPLHPLVERGRLQ